MCTPGNVSAVSSLDTQSHLKKTKWNNFKMTSKLAEVKHSKWRSLHEDLVPVVSPQITISSALGITKKLTFPQTTPHANRSASTSEHIWVLSLRWSSGWGWWGKQEQESKNNIRTALFLETFSLMVVKAKWVREIVLEEWVGEWCEAGRDKWASKLVCWYGSLSTIKSSVDVI